MQRDYAAIIAALREKAKRTEFPEEAKLLNAKADELAKAHNVKEQVKDPFDTDDWIRQNYRMSRDDFVSQFFKPSSYSFGTQPYNFFLIVVTGEDQRWRRSYLWPQDGSPMMNPDHSWQDTDNEQ
jgi:hypothetical protein